MMAGSGRQGTRAVPGPIYVELAEGGTFDPQPSHFVGPWAWALYATSIADERIKQVADGLGLEAELHRFFTLKHWGVVRLQSSRDDCPCGSDQPRKSCRHEVDIAFRVPAVPNAEAPVDSAKGARQE